LLPLPALDIVAACLVSPKTNSPSPAQRSVRAGAQKAISYQFYLEHPEHKAFGKLIGPVLEDVFVIDFWAKP